ncbi:mucin-2-like [Triplophysa dalaica]|uniref:mucin-2-like n=1 Tax=Triplophysa dalaica TaxID=1582913 RepID=UPI0024E00A0F|nr:mucin-2-like [Triplophysa dalaica]
MEWRTSAVCALLLVLTCSIQVNAKRVYTSNHVNNICSMWGNFHFKTFDGDTYQFKGTCEYNLVSDCQSLVHQFSVHVKRTQDPDKSKISRVSVTINDIAVVMTEDLVTVNEENVTLPIHIAGILVEENSIYTKLYSKLGISVMWNREDAVMVELDSKYFNRSCGLCGDFNGIPVYNEFIQSGRRVGYAEFGNLHRVPNPNHRCEDPFEDDETDIQQNVVDSCEKHRAICADIFEDGDWSSCSWVLSPEPYIRACVSDTCQPQPGKTDTASLCSTLSEYSRQCSHAGGTPPTWRTDNFCPVKCPYNMVHSESGSPCMDTCAHKDTNTLCVEHKIDGCFCPPGTVFDDISYTGCIPLEQCQCKHDRIYNAGEILREVGEECECWGGNWICKSVPSPGLCAVEEGSHFMTYDGKEFTFHGDCNYVLSKDCEGSKFIILGQIVPCYNHETDTCLKSIVVMLNNDKRNPLIIKADGKVQHNAEVSLPYQTVDFTVFRPSSFHIIIQSTVGLQVQVQLVPLMQVYITVDQRFQGKTCGLCGNFNKVLSDDLKTPQGMVEGTAISFANTWKAQSNCPDRTKRMDDPCSYSTDSEHFAEHWCSKMRDKESLFAKCHASVNPDSYYKRCKYSSCTCEKSEDCLCAVFSSYARACAAKGIFFQGWRQIVCDKYTENCPVSQNYSYQVQSCQHTCLSLSSERQGCSVDFVPVDGCACPDGLYQDEMGHCVSMEKCPCYHNGLKVKPGRSISIQDEHCVCMNGKFQCRSWKARVLGCPPTKVFFNCSTAGQNEHGLECSQTCSQQEVDCFSLECKSGCQCPTGLLDDGRGNCVKPHDCPCPHNGHSYAAGAEIWRDCNKCNCQGGTWTCTQHKCPGVCSIYGSGHYQTFDQQRFGFRGDCSYIALQDKCGNKTGHFSIVTENIPCGTTGTTCSKAVDVILGRTRLDLSDGKVKATDTGTGPLIKYKKRKVGMYLVIDAENGLTVLWDRITTIRIILQPRHMGNVCGLCGNFNGNGQDDFTTQGNLPTTSIIEFVDTWKASSNCPDSEADFDPCQFTPNRHTWAKIQCSIIKEDTFKDCHSQVDPTPYYDNCVKDTCACDTGGDCECLCTAVAAYAQACNEARVCVDWRTPEICPVYCDYYNDHDNCTWHYSPCHTPCYKTCLNPEGICNNTLPNLEGCYPECPEDKPIFDEESQMCVEFCPISTTTTPPTTTTTGTTPVEYTTSSQTPKTPTVSTSSPTPTTTTTTTGTTPESTATTRTESTTTEFPTSSQTPETPTVSTSSPTPTPPPTSTTTTTGTTPVEYTTSSQTPKTPTVSTSSPTPPTTTTTTTGTTPGNLDIGSGICLNMNCSDICEIQNTTDSCYDCPEWDKNTNETFILCNCTMARCIEDNIIEIIPFECPPLQNITCANRKEPVLVYDEHFCCQQYACDCFCEGWGDPHYITFDGKFYSYQGNCTYILMEEIRPHFHLKIYIDNVYCDPIERVSCPRSIIVSYNGLDITLTNHNLIGGADLEVSKGHEKLALPYTRNGVRVVSSKLDLFLEIPQLGVIVTFGATGFSINLPFQHFGNNTQGHCGTCNNNVADDCMIPGGILVDDCAVMADYWPANGINGEICPPPNLLPTVGTSPTSTPKPCQAIPDCYLLKSELFEDCHPHLSPDNFFLGCEYDSCHTSNPAVVCTSLQSYARSCSLLGICINWRNHTDHCNIECPADKIFKPCGPAEPQTCEDQPEQRSLPIPTEGCFCPDGMMLFNKESEVCVDKCGCLDASGTPREFGEVFKYNCEECVCDKSSKSVICKPRLCPDLIPEKCTQPGYVLVNVTNPSDPCCTKQVCYCDVSVCPSLDKKCSVGYSPELEVPEGKCCPEIKCVAKKVCVHDNKEYEPGSSIPVTDCQECTCTWEVDPKSELYKISCNFVVCKEDCAPGYKYQESESSKDCCGKCVQTHCIVNVNGTLHILKEGEVLPTTDQKCDRITCTKVNGQFITENNKIQCPPFNISNCQPGTVQVMADGCCNVCVDKIKGCHVQTVQDHINHNNCQSERIMDLTFCGGECASYSKYSEPGLSDCNCCQATRTSNRTEPLTCLNGDKITYTYVHVEQCSCRKTNCHGIGLSPQTLEGIQKRSIKLP